MAARKALAARLDHKTLWPRGKRWLLTLITKRYGRAYEQVVRRQTLGGAAQFLRAQVVY